jgi:hypothetical protein
MATVLDVGWVTRNNLESWQPKDHPCHVWFQLAYNFWFHRRFLKHFPHRILIKWCMHVFITFNRQGTVGHSFFSLQNWKNLKHFNLTFKFKLHADLSTKVNRRMRDAKWWQKLTWPFGSDEQKILKTKYQTMYNKRDLLIESSFC